MDSHIIETREFEWKIHNFTNEHLKSDKFKNSEFFSIFLGTDETEWYFCIKFKDGKYGVYLHLKKSEADDFTTKFEAFVHKLSGEKMLNKMYCLRTMNEFKNCNGWGWENFIPHDNLFKEPSQYLKENTLTLGLKIELTKQKQSANPQSDNQYFKMCKNYFNTKSLSDFKIVCSDGIELQAHKFILVEFSPVMEVMIYTKMTESKKNSVSIKDINSETMTEILRFIYTTEVNNLDKLAVQLLHGAEKYELVQLKKLCIESLIKNLSVNNAFDYFILGDKYNSNALLYRSAVFIKLNHKALRDKDWTIFTKKQFITLIDKFQNIPGDVEDLETTL